MAVYAPTLSNPLDLDDIISIVKDKLPVHHQLLTYGTDESTTSSSYVAHLSDTISVEDDEVIIFAATIFTSHGTANAVVDVALDVNGSLLENHRLTDPTSSAAAATLTHSFVGMASGLSGSIAVETQYRDPDSIGTVYVWDSRVHVFRFKYRA